MQTAEQRRRIRQAERSRPFPTWTWSFLAS